jgi:hypothetical protein
MNEPNNFGFSSEGPLLDFRFGGEEHEEKSGKGS